MKYRQLTQKQRYQLETFLALKFSKSEIAKLLGVHRSTIYREMERNSLILAGETVSSYDAVPAQGVMSARRKESCLSRHKVRGRILVYVRKKLKSRWSPEQIAGRMNLESNKKRVSYSSIYRYIYADKSDFWTGERLYKYLRRNLKKRGRRKKDRRLPIGHNAPRMSIRERPKSADKRLRIGHFERDLMEGIRGRKAINVIVDRKSRYTVLGLVRRNGKSVHRSTLSMFKRPKLKAQKKTLTNDNGYEFIFSRLPRIKKQLGVEVYFTDPSSPWQRGTVENTIGLLREFLPKKMDLSFVSYSRLKRIEKNLNHRPRKVLNFQTPFEIFHKQKNKRL